MNRIRRYVLIILVGNIFLESAAAQSSSLSKANTDSLSSLLNLKLSELTSPDLEERQRIRREMQQKGYAVVLSNVLCEDGLGALLSFIRTRLQIEYSISHRPLSLRVQIERGEGKVWHIPLSDDWTFPRDPWEKK